MVVYDVRPRRIKENPKKRNVVEQAGGQGAPFRRAPLATRTIAPSPGNGRMRKRREKVDYSAEMNRHDSPAMRLLFVALGTLFVLLGIAGALLPVLPTTPFMLLAAGCYARASTRFYNWLLNNPTFGPTILEWRRHRSIPWRVKLTAIALMAATLSISIVFFVPWPELQGALALFGLLLATYMYRIPSRDRPR